MPFNSITFFVFLAVVLLLFRILPHKGQNFLLLIASYVFYGWWDIRFLLLIIISTAMDFSAGLIMHEGFISKRDRLIASLWVSLSAFFCVFLQWGTIGRGIAHAGFFSELFSPSRGRMIFYGVLGLIVVANLAYPWVISLEPSRRKRAALLLSITTNLAILGFFKYYNFFITSLEPILGIVGLSPTALHLNIVLPIGISFYTFQSLTYTVDIYRGTLAATPRLSDYALCVAFFPKLLAGPIERAANLLPQLARTREFTREQTLEGIRFILYGLFKKVAVADGIAIVVQQAFSSRISLSWSDAILGMFFFAVEIYCDFSGYSDIAIGVAKLFGIELMQNFNFPYFASNPADFWTRWHISLSSWFRDYVFFPLGGPYGKAIQWIRNVILTFLVTGLWHGAAWNFVFWGMYHGVLLCLHRLRQTYLPSKRRRKRSGSDVVYTLLFFPVICYGWVLFRAESFSQIREFTSVLFSGLGNMHLTIGLPTPPALLGLPILLVMEFVGNRSHESRLDKVLPVPLWTGLCAGMIFSLIMGFGYAPTKFIYFVF